MKRSKGEQKQREGGQTIEDEPHNPGDPLIPTEALILFTVRPCGCGHERVRERAHGAVRMSVGLFVDVHVWTRHKS